MHRLTSYTVSRKHLNSVVELRIILFMARGWESKSVESQIESSQNNHSGTGHNGVEDADRIRRQQALLLSRSRVLQQLQVSQNPHHREMLTQALGDLEAQLAKFE